VELHSSGTRLTDACLSIFDIYEKVLEKHPSRKNTFWPLQMRYGDLEKEEEGEDILGFPSFDLLPSLSHHFVAHWKTQNAASLPRRDSGDPQLGDQGQAEAERARTADQGFPMTLSPSTLPSHLVTLCAMSASSRLPHPPTFFPLPPFSPDKNKPIKRRFLENLKKTVIASKSSLTDTAIRCYVDIVVASTYVAKETTASCLRHLVPPIEQELKDRLLNPAKPYFDAGSPVDIDLLTSFLLACFKLSHRGVVLGFMFPFINGPCIQKPQNDTGLTPPSLLFSLFSLSLFLSLSLSTLVLRLSFHRRRTNGVQAGGREDAAGHQAESAAD
jgi:hypothetical protein